MKSTITKKDILHAAIDLGATVGAMLRWESKGVPAAWLLKLEGPLKTTHAAIASAWSDGI